MKNKKICFLVGSVALSGGTYVILQHASYLRDQGYEVTLAVQEPFDRHTFSWHDRTDRLRIVPFIEGQGEHFDLVVATWWKTALELFTFHAPRYAYFVQSIESRFYPDQEEPLRKLVDATYRLPVSYVTEASWIVRYLKESFHQDVSLVRNGIRKDIYTMEGRSLETRCQGRPRVLVEGHFGVPFKNTALAIHVARKAGASDIWVMTGSPVDWIPGVSRVFSRVPIHKTPEIYRSCDILLKLSTVEGMFGPPLEMFHCGGTALVFDVSGHEEYIRANDNAIVIKDRNINHAISELRRLLSDQERLLTLQHKAGETARAWPGWAQSSEEFSQWVGNVLKQPPSTDKNGLKDIIEAVHARYVEEENQRLAAGSFGAIWHYRFKKYLTCLPGGFKNKLRQTKTCLEIIFPPRKVF